MAPVDASIPTLPGQGAAERMSMAGAPAMSPPSGQTPKLNPGLSCRTIISPIKALRSVPAGRMIQGEPASAGDDAVLK